MFSNKLILFLIAILSASDYTHSALCPPEILTACACNATTREISCRGTDIPIGEVFEKLSELIPGEHRDFDTFYLNSRSVTRLEANQFKGIRFRAVFLGGSKLTHIHRDAFFGTHLHLKELFAFATNLSISEDPEYNLFESITLLKDLQRLVISGSNIHTIPHRAFKPRNPEDIQRNLTDIELGLTVNPSITSIGSEAFADLPALRTLGLSNHKINYIYNNAFSSDDPTNNSLTLDLTGNNLNDTSFEIKAFSGTNRAVKIYFGLNGCNKNLTFLNQTIFEPFLNDNQLNTIDVGRGCTLVCDCRMDWIVVGNYESRIRNLKCRDGRTFTESTDSLDNTLSKCRSIASVGITSTLISNTIKPKALSNNSRSLYDDYEDNNELDFDYEESEPKVNLCLTDECFEVSIEMKKYLNKSLNPCENFYDYACGRWEDSHLLEYLVQLLSNGGLEYDNFVKLRQQIDVNLDSLLSESTESNELNIIKQTINMYQICKQNASFNKQLLMDTLNKIDGWPIISPTHAVSSGYEWQNALAFIFSYIRSDILITFDYIINENSIKQLKVVYKDIASYAKYIHDVAVLLGASPSGQSDNSTINSALDVIKFESELAKISDKSTGKEFQVDRPLKTLKCFIPEVDWIGIIEKVLQNHNISAEEFNEMNVILDIHYMTRLSLLLRKTDSTIIANYLGWRTVESLGFMVGGTPFLEIQRTFHDIQSNERTKLLWRQCLNPLKEHLPYVLTRNYAKAYLTQADKQLVSEIVKTVKQSFVQLIREKEWLADKTEFINKVDAIKENVGYPDWLLDDNQFLTYHQNLSLQEESKELSQFYINLWSHSMKQYLLTVGKRVDKSYEWDQSPLYVGASYDISENLITLPIGLLHPPFYDSKRPAYINFGSIGSFVGHEISHASMPRYDSEERLLQPWNDINIKQFLSKAKCFVDQYSAYFDHSSDMNLDGMKTFEEDIGDIAGLKASYNAFNNLINENVNKVYNDIKLLPNFSQYSPQQLFFLSYAQKWCRYITPTQVRIKILRGVHSPEKYRVNGALSNFDEFSNAFNCPVGSHMNPEAKCELW